MSHNYLLLAGHGGMAFGHYLTPGKRSPEVGPNVGIYEGEFNRAICQRVFNLHVGENIEFLNPGPYNIRQYDRVDLVNDIHRRASDCILIVVHANAAAGNGWSNANGFRVFHSTNASKKSCQLAEILSARMHSETTLFQRTIAEKNFTILYKTKCPAVLLECGFMTNRADAAYMASERGKSDITSAIVSAIKQFEEEK
jgi:N-acetylmuramoyl-L-alanine amidase